MKETDFVDRLTGNKIKTKNKNPSRWDKNGNLIDAHGKAHASDFNMVACEAYNAGKNTLIFTSMNDNFDVRKCLPDTFLFLPHRYYVVTTSDGEPAKILFNYGDEKFKGNKKASRPEVKKMMIGGK